MKRPWMPFYPADFFTSTLALDYDEIGVYIKLLCLAWMSGDGSVTGDMAELKKVLQNCTSNFHGLTFNRIVPKLLKMFFYEKDGRMYQERVEKELRKAEEISEKQSRNAKERWSPSNKINNLDQAIASGVVIPIQHNTTQYSKKESCPVGKPTRTKAEYSEQFEKEFWNPYPRSPTMSKVEAWKVWQKLPPEKRVLACKAIDPYKRFLRSKPDLATVHACRFLSQERFEGLVNQAGGAVPIDIGGHFI